MCVGRSQSGPVNFLESFWRYIFLGWYLFLVFRFTGILTSLCACAELDFTMGLLGILDNRNVAHSADVTIRPSTARDLHSPRARIIDAVEGKGGGTVAGLES